MKSSEYWQKRSEQIAQRQHNKADAYEAGLKREYARSIQLIQRDIEVFYRRFADNNGIIDMAEARKLLSSGEMKEFKMTLEEFTEKAKNNADGRWTQQLNNVYFRTRVSRLEALQVQVRQQAEMLAGSQQKGVGKLLGDIYSDTYYRTLFEIQKGVGIGASFARIDAEGLQKVLGTEFIGSNWSKRIWGDRDKLVRELQTKLSQALIRGESVDRTVRDITERFDVSRSNAERLVQTESAFFTEQATADGYKASGVVQKYEILATLDKRTSEICRGMDGKVFPLSEKEVGVNFPPFHARCRTTVMPYFDDEIDPGERIARGEDGKTYFVPGDMTYEEWKKKYVDSSKSVIIESDKHFADIMSKTPNVRPEYMQVLVDRFATGSDEARRAFAAYVQDNVVNETNNQNAHYNPVDQVINMDFSGDFKNPRGPGATYFHEVGHYIDNMAAIKALGKQTYDGVSHISIGGIGDRDFYKAILDDVQNHLNQYMKDNNVSMVQAQDKIRERFRQADAAIYSAVSDVYGGATGNRLRGLYGHANDYWKRLPHALEKEAFAHMFEASFDPTGNRLDLIKKYLPTSYEIFKKILGAI